MNWHETDLGPWILTLDGKQFHFQAIDVAAIEPKVIAHALSNLCRFTGHVRDFYSVAQHCVLVSRLVPPEMALWGLLHDAAEAFVGDVSRPLKDLIGESYKNVEHNVEIAIAGRFGLDWPMPPEVKTADWLAFVTEVRDVLPGTFVRDFGYDYEGIEPLPDPIYPWTPHTARQHWMNRFNELGGS